MVIVAGGIDLSVGSIIALSTVVIALLLARERQPVRRRAWRGGGSGAICGLVNGLLITQLKVVPFIVTLGHYALVRGVAKGLADERRIEAPATWLNDLLRVPQGSGLLPPGIWMVAALALIVAGVLRYTRFGRHVFAIGSNERTARLCGVAIDAHQSSGVHADGGAVRALQGCCNSRSSRSATRPSPSARARRDRRRHHRRRKPLGRARHDRRNHHWRDDHGHHSDRLLPEGLANWVQQIVTGGIIVVAVALDRVRSSSV